MDLCNGENKDLHFFGDPLQPPYHPNCKCVWYGDLPDPDPGDGGERMEPRQFVIIIYRRRIHGDF